MDSGVQPRSQASGELGGHSHTLALPGSPLRLLCAHFLVLTASYSAQMSLSSGKATQSSVFSLCPQPPQRTASYILSQYLQAHTQIDTNG